MIITYAGMAYVFALIFALPIAMATGSTFALAACLLSMPVAFIGGFVLVAIYG